MEVDAIGPQSGHLSAGLLSLKVFGSRGFSVICYHIVVFFKNVKLIGLHM